MENRVYFAPCADYGEETVRAAFDRLLPEGALDFVTPGMRVAIKVNLVTAMMREGENAAAQLLFNAGVFPSAITSNTIVALVLLLGVKFILPEAVFSS